MTRAKVRNPEPACQVFFELFLSRADVFLERQSGLGEKAVLFVLGQSVGQSVGLFCCTVIVVVVANLCV